MASGIHVCKGAAPSVLAFTTKTGLDVLPGIYRVLVTYNTAEGAKTQQYEIDLR